MTELARCVDDSFAEFWLEKWLPSLGPSWQRPLTEQFAAMFPRRCSYVNHVVRFDATDWVIVTPSVCVQLTAPTVQCQKWFHFAACTRSMGQDELLEYERELYPELCDVGAG